MVPLPSWKRAVLKVGSTLVAPEGRRVSNENTIHIAAFIAQCRAQGKEIILVSSGAVAAGLSVLSRGAKPLTIREKQALAAVGQPLLMTHWSKYFDFPCAQLLLTFDDLKERRRFVNAKNTLMELLERRVLPIINENDTTVVDELRVGDNDNLAAYAAVLAEADLLLIASDIDGLFDKDPKQYADAQLISFVEKIDASIYALAGGRGSGVSTGGMITKLQAAEKAALRGIDTIIFNGTRQEAFAALSAGECPGTYFQRVRSPITAKKHWMLHTARSKGVLIIDDGAKRALLTGGASLLPSGIVDVQGRFKPGDFVDIYSQQKEYIAKGLCQYETDDLRRIMGRKSHEILSILGYITAEEVVHRNDLVLMGANSTGGFEKRREDDKKSK
ncbi:MAG: glutamate 5-kinase [candidate division KSB1 bacterium]|nr:glutamate 5-kinase [candidate division KSB1 bacterium]